MAEPFRIGDRVIRSRSGTSIQQPLPQQDDPFLVPEEEEEDTGVLTSLGAAFSSGNTITAVNRAIESSRPRFEPRDGFKPLTHIREQGGTKDWVVPLINMDEDVAARIGDTNSPEELDHVLGLLEESQGRWKEAFDNGAFVGISGILAGGLLSPETLIGVGGLRALVTTARSMRAARLAGALRLGGVGAAEGAGFTALEQVADPSIGVEELLLGAGGGTALGAGLGSAFPRALGGISFVDDLVETSVQDAADVAARASRHANSAPAPESAGAAASPLPATGEVVPAPGSSGGVLSRLGPLSSPKSVIVRMGTEARDQLDPYSAPRRAFGVANRLFRFETPMAHEVGGAARREASAQTLFEELEGTTATRILQWQSGHREMLQDVFGSTAPVIRRRHGSSVPMPGQAVSQREFGELADELAIARSRGITWEIPQDYKLTQEQRTKFMSRLNKRADEDDAFFKQWGEWEVEAGLIGRESLIEGYRPQRWNVSEILDDPVAMEDLLVRTFNAQPPKEFLESNGVTKSWDQLLNSDSELADDLLGEWTARNRDDLQSRRDARVRGLEDTLRATREEGADEAIIKIEQRREKELRRYAQQDVKASQFLKGAPIQARLERAIARTVARIEGLDAELELARTARESITGIDSLIRRSDLNRAARVRRLQARLTKAEDSSDIVRTLKTPQEMAREVIQNITGSGKGVPMGFATQDLIPETGFFKRRSIDLGELRPQAKKFLRTDPNETLQAYTRAVGARLALKRAFGTEDVDDILREVDGDFLQDIRAAEAAGDTKGRKLLIRQKEEYSKQIKKAIEVFTNKHVLDGSPTMHFWAAQLSRFNVVTMLGKVVLSAVADIATGQLAKGKLGGTVQSLVMAPRTVKVMRQLAKDPDKASLKALIMGFSNVNNMRLARNMDIQDLSDPMAIGASQSWARRASRGLDAATHTSADMMMRLSLQSFWNKANRDLFGVSFIHEIGKDLAKFDSLPKQLRTFYARHGIDGEMAARINTLLSRDFLEVEGVKFPNEKVWSTKDAGALRAFRQALNGAGKEAVIEPTLGDTPWAALHPVGRLFLQFLSFPYAASQKFVRPGMTARDANMAVAITMALALGGLNDYARAALRGEESAEAWRTRMSENPQQLFYSSFIRSPLSVGPTGTLAEFGVKGFGRPANDIVEAMTGARPLPQSARFTERNAFSTLLGPSYATGEKFTSLAQLSIGGVTNESDRERLARRAESLAPFASLFYIQWAETILKEALE